MFTKINLDTFATVYDKAMTQLRAALASDAAVEQLVGADVGGESPLLQLGVMAIFSAHEARAGVAEPGRYMLAP